MVTAQKRANVERALAEIEKVVGPLSNVTETPDQYVRNLHQKWKALGGKASSGKPRHSDRYLEDRLKAKGTPVRSLTQKLARKTRLSPEDAATLTQYFLDNWPTEQTAGTSEQIQYKTLLSKSDLFDLTEKIKHDLETSKIGDLPVLCETDAR